MEPEQPSPTESEALEQPSPIKTMRADEYFTLLSVVTEKMFEVKTPAELDEEFMVMLMLLHERLPDPASVARATAGFMRGVLEGAGCRFPWMMVPVRRGGPSAKRARARSKAPRRAGRARRRS